ADLALGTGDAAAALAGAADDVAFVVLADGRADPEEVVALVRAGAVAVDPDRPGALAPAIERERRAAAGRRQAGRALATFGAVAGALDAWVVVVDRERRITELTGRALEGVGLAPGRLV